MAYVGHVKIMFQNELVLISSQMDTRGRVVTIMMGAKIEAYKILG